MTVSFGGEQWRLPADATTLTDLYENWQAAGAPGDFEVRDLNGKLLAVGLKLRHGPRRRPPDFDLSDDD